MSLMLIIVILAGNWSAIRLIPNVKLVDVITKGNKVMYEKDGSISLFN